MKTEIQKLLKTENPLLDKSKITILSYELAEAHAIRAIEQLAKAIEILGDLNKCLNPDVRSQFIVDSLKIATELRTESKKVKKMVMDNVNKITGEAGK